MSYSSEMCTDTDLNGKPTMHHNAFNIVQYLACVTSLFVPVNRSESQHIHVLSSFGARPYATDHRCSFISITQPHTGLVMFHASAKMTRLDIIKKKPYRSNMTSNFLQ